MSNLWKEESRKRPGFRDGRIVRSRLVMASPLALLLAFAPARAQSSYAQVSCPAGETTTISGTVYDPAGINPLPNILVYVPGAAVQPFTDGVNTSDPVQDSYTSLVSGSPMVQTTTGINGSFTLSDVPAGTNVPLVIQSGRWRRQLVIAQVAECVSTALYSAPASPPSTTTVGATETEPSGLSSSNVTQGGSSSLTDYGEPTTVRFARNQEEGDIPHIALVTGAVDALECTLRKAGISDSEFTDLSVGINSTSSDPSAGPTGRVNLYNGIGNSGVSAPSYYTSSQAVTPTHTESVLMGSGSETSLATTADLFANTYNVLMLPCQGDDNNYTSLQGETNAAWFINSGGRIFATHHSAFYIDNPNGETSSQDSVVYDTALAADNWNNSNSGPLEDTPSISATINQGFPDGATLAAWLQNLGATTTQGSLTLDYDWNNQSGVDSAYKTLSWATDTDNGDVMQLSFYAPVCSDAGCSQFGQVMYNEYHVDNASENASTVFPNECVDDSGSSRAKSSAMSPQEMMLEYSLFNMMSFAVPTLTPPTLSITASPSTTFTDGESSGSLTFSVTNPNNTSITTYPTVTLNISLPSGMSAVSMIDPNGGWSCSVATLGCTLMHPIDAGATDSVTVAVTVSADAPATNTAVVSATASSSAFSSSATQNLIISTVAAPPNTVTGPTMTTLPNTPVGSTNSGTVTFGVSSGTTISSVAVVTEGLPNLDFTLASGNTCVSSSSYSSAINCTVTVNFSPRAPGLRLGAVEIFGSSGALLDTAYISGIGMGAEAALEPGTLSTLLSSGLSAPGDLTADVLGNLYIASSGNSQIVELAQGVNTATLFAGGGSICSNSSDSIGDGCSPTHATLNSPQGVTLDGAGNLYIADQGDDVLREVSAVTGIISTVAGTPGASSSSGDGGPATGATFEKLDAVAVDGSGNLYAADAGACVVREITAADKEINTIAGTGVCGYTATSGVATSMRIGAPSALALDSSGNLYITDSSNLVVWKLTLSSGALTVTAGTPGQAASSTGDGGPATSATFTLPAGVAVDAAGDLYILDNNAAATRLRMVSPSTGIITTIAGGGNQSGSGIPATQAALAPGGGVALDAAGDLYLTATSAGSVEEITSTAATMPFPTPTPVGSTDTTDGVDGFEAVTLTNIGNQDLTAVTPGIAASDSTDFVQQTGASSACAPTFSLGFGRGCSLGYEFAPQTFGSLSNTVTLTDNSYQAALNQQTAGQQTALFSGTSSGNSTATTVNSAQTVYNPTAQSVTLSAAVTDTTNSGTTVSSGTITFTVYSGTTLIGSAVGNIAVNNGTASANYSLPAGTAAGTYTLTAAYSGATDFTASTSTGGTLTVNPASGTLAITGPASGFYGSSATVTFSGSYSGTPTLKGSTAGVCTVNGATVTYTGVGTCTLTASTSAGNYGAVTSSPYSISVSAATPTLTLSPANPASINYGSSTTLSVIVTYPGGSPPTGVVTLSAGGISASATCSGASGTSMTCTASVPTSTLAASTTPYTVSASIAAAGNYGAATSANSSLTVNQATATVTLGSSTQTYTGAPISATATTSPGSLPVTLTYTGTSGTSYPASSTPPTNAGTYTITATVNSTNYTGTATSVMTIAKATPAILWVTPSPITYGTALTGTQLDASATFNNVAVAGTFVYSPAAGAVLSTGQQTLNVSFTPANTTDFNPATASTTLTVNKATATITLGNLSQTYTGSPLSATAASNPGSLPVTLTYTGTAYPASTTPPTNAGTYAVTATVNSTNYSGTATGVMTIAKATPAILWTTPSPITYGTALTGTQLGASASFNNTAVAGTFLYSPAAGDVLSVGQQTLNVSFTPADTTDFNPASASTTLTVNKANATVTLGNLLQTYTGSPLSATVSANPTAAGVSLTYSGSSPNPPTAPGSYPVTATVSNSNYTGSTAGTLIIRPATPAITLTGSPNATLALSPVFFNVTVAAASGTPTGTVTLMAGTTAVGTAALTGGVANFTSSALPDGADSITAVYSGSTDYVGLSSAPVTEDVLDFTLQPTGSAGASQTVMPKVAATFQVAVIPNIGDSLPASSVLSVSGLAPGGTVTLNTQPWVPLSATSWQVPANTRFDTLSFTFTVPLQDLIETSRLHPGALHSRTRSSHRSPALWAILLLPLALRLRRSGRRFAQRITLLLLLTAGAVLSTTLSGCGANVSVPIGPQAYNITVTLTSGSLTHSTVLTLAVK